MPKSLLLIACFFHLAGCSGEGGRTSASGSGGTVGPGIGGASGVGGALDTGGTIGAGNNVGGSGPAMGETAGEGTTLAGGTLGTTGGATAAIGGADSGGRMGSGGAAAVGGYVATGGTTAGGAAAPQNLTVPPLAFEDTQVTVVWDKPLTGKASGYDIYANRNKVGSVSKVVYPSGDSNQQLFFDITGLSPSTLYTITVRALDASGAESTDSNSVTQMTTAIPVAINPLCQRDVRQLPPGNLCTDRRRMDLRSCPNHFEILDLTARLKVRARLPRA